MLIICIYEVEKLVIASKFYRVTSINYLLKIKFSYLNHFIKENMFSLKVPDLILFCVNKRNRIFMRQIYVVLCSHFLFGFISISPKT